MAVKKPGKSREAEIIRLDEAAGPQLPGMEVAQVRAALDATTDPHEVEAVRARAKGLQDALRSPAAAEIVGCNDPGEIRRKLVDMAEAILWAKRRLGELAGDPRPGERRDLTSSIGGRGSTSPMLGEVGHGELGRYRDLASIPIAAFEAALIEARQAGREPTQTALLKLAPPRPKPEPKRAPVRPPALTRARRIVGHATRRLGDVASGNPDGCFEVAFVAELLGGIDRLLEEPRTPLERAELLLQVVADHLESAVLPKLGAATDGRRHGPSCACESCNNGALMAMEDVVDRLREDASEVERVRTGVIAPRDVRDTSYAKPYRIPKPRDE